MEFSLAVQTAGIVSTDGRSLENAEIGSPPTTSENVRSPITTSGEGQVLGVEDFVMIQALVKRGVYLADIAEHTSDQLTLTDIVWSLRGRR